MSKKYNLEASLNRLLINVLLYALFMGIFSFWLGSGGHMAIGVASISAVLVTMINVVAEINWILRQVDRVRKQQNEN